MTEKTCRTCLYSDSGNPLHCQAEQCGDPFTGWRPKESISVYPSLKSHPSYGDGGGGFADKLREALPEGKKFSLDKLIDDHWGYNESFMRLLKHNNYTKEDIIALCKFMYTSSALHFWKHCKEHYRIKEKSDE